MDKYKFVLRCAKEGKTLRDVAKLLHTTRSAIAGYAHRNKISFDGNLKQKLKERANCKKTKEFSPFVPLIDALPCQCRWPEGYASVGVPVCCGALVRDKDSPYCEKHYAMSVDKYRGSINSKSTYSVVAGVLVWKG